MPDDRKYVVPRRRLYPEIYPSLSDYLQSISPTGPPLKTKSLPAKLIERAKTPVKKAEPVQQYGAVAVFFIVPRKGGRSRSSFSQDEIQNAPQHLTFNPDGDTLDIEWRLWGAANVSKASLQILGKDGELWAKDLATTEIATSSGRLQWEPKTAAGEPLASEESLLQLKLSIEGTGKCTAREAWTGAQSLINWIDIELLEQDGDKPMGGVDYQVQLPGGQLREGQLDENGACRIERFPDGECLVKFPQFDQTEAVWIGASDPPPPEDPELDWVEFELLDEEGQPLAGEPYRVEFADGQIREGQLDEKGFLRIEGIASWQCSLVFPQIDRTDWRLTPARGVVPAPDPEPAPKTDWIEIELIDEDTGLPMAEEPYWIQLPDETVREGTLDQDGFCRLEAVPAGICEVRFPRIDSADAVQARPKKKAASPAPSQPVSQDQTGATPAQDGWLELELLDQDGSPVAGASYQIELSDGTLQEGTLDEDGSARLDGLASGTYTVRFTEIDESEFSET